VLILNEFLKDKVRTVLRANVGAIILICLGTLNICCLGILLILPAGNGEKRVTEFLYNHYHSQHIRLYYTPYANPFATWPSLNENFYKLKNVIVHPLTGPDACKSIQYRSDSVTFVALRKYDNDYFRSVAFENGLEPTIELQSIPVIAQNAMEMFPNFDIRGTIILYRVKR
jgi:hypothetical protein